MKILNTLLFSVLFSFALHAQMINNGASMVVQEGAALMSNTSLFNQANGSLYNDGYMAVSRTIENAALASMQGDGSYVVRGDWLNEGTFFADASNVIFYSSGESLVLSNGQPFYRLSNSKQNGEVRLKGDISILDRLDMGNRENTGLLRLGEHNLRIEEGAEIRNFRKGRHIITDDTGKLIMLGIDAGFFPVGASETEYNPVEFSFYSNEFQDDIAVRAFTNHLETGTDVTLANDAVQMFWEIEGSDDLLPYVMGAKFFWEGHQATADFDETVCAPASLSPTGNWQAMSIFQNADLEDEYFTTDSYNYPMSNYGYFTVIDENYGVGLTDDSVENRSSANENESSIAIYPNPTTDYVILSPNFTQTAQVQLYDVSGKLLLQQQLDFEKGVAQRMELPTSLQIGGNYWVRVVADDMVFIKETLVVIP